MSQSINAIRGMNDILPEEMPLWHWLEDCLRQVAAQYGYQEIRMPLLEKTQLFTRTIGEVTDIVEKEMYTFQDRGGESLSLRPEGTAGCVRACLEHRLIQERSLRVWYSGPMYRYERPQQGRYRQFYQFGLEAFGMATPDCEAEILALTWRLWQRLGLSDSLTLKINSLGDAATRERYRADLIKYFKQHETALDEDSKRRLTSNPLRILDSKNPEMQALIEQAPQLLHYLDQEAQDHFATLQSLLRAMAIPFEIAPRLVRGLDYYTKTVFEWQTDRLGAQNAVCAGGRYDRLVADLGGPTVPACGFALGMERLVALLTQNNNGRLNSNEADIYVIIQNQAHRLTIAPQLETLRSTLPHQRIMQHCGEASLKSQFKRADKSGARYALVFGEQEVADGTVTLKDLQSGEQRCLVWPDLKEFFSQGVNHE